jgi:NADH pyrophosphatase NudC (nudix superfamily)
MDNEEMADVRWFDREEVLLALDERSDVLAIPGSLAIAYHLIRAWALREAG